MYALLRRFLSPRLAGLALALWYALLVFLVVLFCDASGLEFRYATL